MRRPWLWMIALGVCAAVRASTPDASIERFLDREMPASGMPGVTYAVVDHGRITAMGARGVARIGGHRALTPDTPFLTGSISKSFTALAVMQLVEAGKVTLDGRLSDYLAGFSGRPGGAITIRQLLSHTSGFSTRQGNTPPARGVRGRDALADRVEQLQTVTPAYPPGTRWAYSNTNYQILGRLVEVVSGQSYQAYVTTHILQPVGMTHSFVADGRVHEAMATGHRPWFGSERPMAAYRLRRASAPQGGIVASASDLALYLRMMMDGRDDVLGAAEKALMMRPASKASPFYGLGWFVDADNGTVWHGGTSPGFETLATMVPARRKAVVVLVNAGSGLGFAETAPLRDGITDRALGLAERRWGIPVAATAPVHRPGAAADVLRPRHAVGVVPPWAHSRQDPGRAVRRVQPVVSIAHHAGRRVGVPCDGAVAERRAPGHRHPVPARPGLDPGRQCRDRTAVGRVPTGPGVQRTIRRIRRVGHGVEAHGARAVGAWHARGSGSCL